LKDVGIESLKAKYIKTPKNSQVSGFYEMVGFTQTKSLENEKVYQLKLTNYKNQNVNYIKIDCGNEN